MDWMLISHILLWIGFIAMALINLALWRIQRDPALAHDGFRVPRWLPLAGFAASTGFLFYQLWYSLLR